LAKTVDHLIVGGGVVGLATARALLKKKAGTVAVLEKESALGAHASGRNSGVVHAGIYYKPGTLKAKLCVEGARTLLNYAGEHGIEFERIGKIIVASDAREAKEVERLHAQAKENGVRAELVDEADLMKLEPSASTFRKALLSPDTAVIDSKAVLEHLSDDILRMGGKIHFREKAVRFVPSAGKALTGKEEWNYGHLVNTAGLHADAVAHAFGAGREYRILPVKGMYRKLSASAASKYKRLIYPVPDPSMPFLGVHLTKKLDGGMLAGPTAWPVLGRENYEGLAGMKVAEGARVLFDIGRMFLTDTNRLRGLARQEMARASKDGFFKELRKIAPALEPSDLGEIVTGGIRAQLIEVKTGRFEMDFIVCPSERSTHVLNAVSPAFTCSLSFADWLAEGILKDGR
jgi:(S)-2-hydroxyglutarate dehydrogenase